MQKFPVVIVGGGPVGVGLAVELGQRGVACALIERRTGLQNIPKGQNLTPRTLEHFYFWGAVDALRAARVMPKGYPESGITAYKNLMSEYWYAPPQREIVRPYYFQSNDRLPQYLSEKVLRERMRQLPAVESRLGWQATRITQDEKGATVTVREESSGREEVLEAQYVVGCDGSHSSVREQIGIERSGADYDQVMVLAVLRSKELHRGLERFPGRSTYRAMDPALRGYWMFFGRIDVGEGWFFHAPVPKDTTKTNYDFKGLVQRAAGFEFAAEFDHVGFWDMRVAVAERYQVGRVFIAGDAAHSHPPYGGFGLNNGLEDAVNLGWKLAATLQGWGGPRLLASYSEERRAIFKETGEDFIASRIEADRAFLERYTPERNKSEFENAWKEMAGGAGDRIMTYEPHYEGSSVVIGPPGARCSAHGSHTYEARVGHHLPPRPLSSGRNVFEELGRGFTLIALDATDEDVASFERAASASNLPFKTVRDTFADERREWGVKMALVRPDQYIVWAGDRAPADVRSMMERVSGR
jgi:2-polyprenyl-6-methoxyphenol hydroxylase-like FAD-dependent oxidoreductase